MERLVCKRYMKVAFAKTGEREAILTRLRCKQWSCEACAKTNQWIWRNWLLKRLPEVSSSWWVVTLTAPPYARTRTQSLATIRGGLDAFFKRCKRVFGPIEYVRIYEKHPSSEAIHVHIIICGLSPFVAFSYNSKRKKVANGVGERGGRNGVWAVKTWIKKTAQALSMGYIADCQKIDNGPEKAVWYVTKYATKAQEELHEKWLRHVQVSRGIGSPPKSDSDLVWETAYFIVPSMVGHKTKVTDLNTGFVIDGDNFWEHTSFYPNED